MKEKVIWWIQFIVNCLFFLVLFFKIASLLPLSFALSNIAGIVIIVLSPILGYALTVKFKNKD
ncbi:hypothetical protein [Ligilactobacillus acidipiscis]|uniref:hypothetical protein n=1 Tax=Ligilactobacillus acidipiscis TaxID=89059 RepID=UPI0023FA3411|nr:hypothetical protein [Ligilactobacillus acidipiscis]WEV57458.1 hypothetical protein OZX66_02620 [Ligilactobacillus acidipiscis]